MQGHASESPGEHIENLYFWPLHQTHLIRISVGVDSEESEFLRNSTGDSDSCACFRRWQFQLDRFFSFNLSIHTQYVFAVNSYLLNNNAEACGFWHWDGEAKKATI